MPLFRIPLLQRVVNVTTNATCFPKKIEVLHVDEVGIFLHYDEEWQKNINHIRKHTVFRHNTRCLVEADNASDAIKKFYLQFEGARVGGIQREAKALWINKDEYIYELPPCILLNKNKEGQFICGELAEYGNGEYGMCILEGCDSPENCPISKFLRNWEEEGVVERIRKFNVVRPIKFP